ncbi:tetratricopeptide repeat protein [Desulfovibrio sp. OttesenSCG-928-A18]|nr:tetratricopeptide repeat protein [Desulfovibrio sp. OttesenSCG-928-A18]
MIRAGQSGHRVTLNRKDMIVFEQRLIDCISRLIPFTSHSMHFPRANTETSATWIAGEKRLLLPVADAKGDTLGVFVARGADPKCSPGLMPLWPALSELIADNLLQYKRSLSDPVTGLFSRHYLLHCMEREIETLRDPIRQAPPKPGTATDPAAGSIARGAARSSADGLVQGEVEPARRSCLGTLVVRLAALRDVVREFGYQFADELMAALADALTGICPGQALAARTGDSEFAVLLPASGPRACRRLAADIVQTLRQVYVVHPLRREAVGISASVGYTFYPQDVAGKLFVRPSAEQARLVLRKARLAAAIAGEGVPMLPGRADQDGVMGFGRILAEGGWVTENLPLSRVMVSLGANMHAREGQRFSVWSTRYPAQMPAQRFSSQFAGAPHGSAPAIAQGPAQSGGTAPLYKGEIVLMEVYADHAQAEIIHLGEPGWNIGPGDHLVLLPDEKGSLARGRGGEPKVDAATGLLRHGDFLADWAEARDKCDSFALALIRLAPSGKSGFYADLLNDASADAEDEEAALGRDPDAADPQSEEPASYDEDNGESGLAHPGRFMSEAVALCQEELGASVIGGRYSLNSLIFFHPLRNLQKELPALKDKYEKLSKEIAERLRLEVAVGIAPHPCLDFRKADALDNCRKALEYAILLSRPHVGLLDSLALNISADKRFSQGDTFGAIKEYQQALLADESNGMAWNSLGICLAGLSRHAEAERHFAKALECNPKDAMALYNLGHMHQSQGQLAEARSRYEDCLTLEPDHLYAMVRLGQLSESVGDTGAARKWYEKAAILPGGESLTYRHFARLCISEGKQDEAREHLHEALLYDPQDALSMALLAGLYLDGGEDPEMAASLARQSVSLRPDLKAGWLQLSRALEIAGSGKEADEARLKAG